jgi:hypothetical protein
MASKDEVLKGRLIYTCLCGWIDLGHAQPSGPQWLWNSISAERGMKTWDGKGFRLTYGQEAKKLGIVLPHRRDYWVARDLSKSQKESVALSIFMEVSLGFEALQDNALIKLFSNSNSGYSVEDLVSNLIAFYRVVRPGTDYIAACERVSQSAALNVWNAHPAIATTKNRAFKPLLYPCAECNQSPGSEAQYGPLPSFLNQITPAKKGTLFRNWSGLDLFGAPR